jgi:hypothetical protein
MVVSSIFANWTKLGRWLRTIFTGVSKLSAISAFKTKQIFANDDAVNSKVVVVFSASISANWTKLYRCTVFWCVAHVSAICTLSTEQLLANNKPIFPHIMVRIGFANIFTERAKLFGRLDIRTVFGCMPNASTRLAIVFK